MRSLRQVTFQRPLRDCSVEELAIEQITKHASGGVSFARKVEHVEKDIARNAVLNLFSPAAYPDPLSVLTMPGLRWTFETQLFRLRVGKARGTYLTCIESDRALYHAELLQLTRVQPGIPAVIEGRRAGSFAEQAVKCRDITLFLGDINSMMQSGEHQTIAAWLDYTGPLSAKRLRTIAKFFKNSVRDLLVITALGARWDAETSAAIKRAGGHTKWIRRSIAGNLLHEINYQDGPSPMLQVAISKLGCNRWDSPRLVAANSR